MSKDTCIEYTFDLSKSQCLVSKHNVGILKTSSPLRHGSEVPLNESLTPEADWKFRITGSC